jgi:hypothetical protein
VLGAGGLIAAIAGIELIVTVFAAVYHAEVVARRTGEPFGTTCRLTQCSEHPHSARTIVPLQPSL